MSEVKRWYIGVYGGEAQARGCSPHAREIIRETQGETFVLDADFERVDMERDALQQRLTAADERADVLEALLRDAIGEIKYLRGDKHACKGLDMDAAEAALKPAEVGGDE